MIRKLVNGDMHVDRSTIYHWIQKYAQQIGIEASTLSEAVARVL